MSLTSVVGILASIFSAFSLLPQLVKIIREKKAAAVSVGMLITLFAGICCWIWYGILKEDLIIIVSNSLSLLLNIATLFFTIRYQ